jgi:hypothetical protein
VALAQALRVIIYHVISHVISHVIYHVIYHVSARRQPSHELGEDSFQRLDPQARAQRLLHQLGRLGFDVQLLAQHTSASPAEASVLIAGL